MSLIVCLTAVSCVEVRLRCFITSLNIFNHNLRAKSRCCFRAPDATSEIEVFFYEMEKMGKQCALKLHFCIVNSCFDHLSANNIQDQC